MATTPPYRALGAEFLIHTPAARTGGRLEEVAAGESITVPGGAAHSYLAHERSTWVLALTGETRVDEFVRQATEHGVELLGPPPAERR